MECCIKDCQKPVLAKSMCAMHYRRVKIHGDPNHTKAKQLHGLTLKERFEAYVDHTGECWEWRGSRDKKGYGRLNIKGTPTLTHRLSWELSCGPIPAGKNVLHRCDNPQCVRPEHLFLGDHAMNMADKMAKKRHRYGVSRGTAHGCSRLTDDQVRAIRASEGPSRIIGEQFGISGRQVREIRARTSWRHIP